MDLEERVRRLAAAVVGGGDPSRITSVARFEAGDRHAVYRVTCRDDMGATDDVVVRVSTGNDDAERVQAEREAAVLEALQGVGAPKLYDFRTDSQWFDTPTMCMEFVDGEHRELLAARPEDVERLGAVVASVHNLAVGELAGWFAGPSTMADYVAGWVELIASYPPRLRAPLPPSVQPRVERALSIVNGSLQAAPLSGSFGGEDALVLLHGDVGPGNVLWSDHPVLIDWEYARLGDPADEVAYIFGQHGLMQSQRERFWRGYRSATTHPRLEQVIERVRWWEPVTLLGSALWWLERWSHLAGTDPDGVRDRAAGKPPGYYLDHALRRLDRFDLAVDAGSGSPR